MTVPLQSGVGSRLGCLFLGILCFCWGCGLAIIVPLSSLSSPLGLCPLLPPTPIMRLLRCLGLTWLAASLKTYSASDHVGLARSSGRPLLGLCRDLLGLPLSPSPCRELILQAGRSWVEPQLCRLGPGSHGLLVYIEKNTKRLLSCWAGQSSWKQCSVSVPGKHCHQAALHHSLLYRPLNTVLQCMTSIEDLLCYKFSNLEWALF